jgi:hypothetical protein
MPVDGANDGHRKEEDPFENIVQTIQEIADRLKVIFSHTALQPDEIYSLGPVFRISGNNHDRCYRLILLDFIKDMEKFPVEDGVKPVFSVFHCNNGNALIPFPFYDSHTGTSVDSFIYLCHFKTRET